MIDLMVSISHSPSRNIQKKVVRWKYLRTTWLLHQTLITVTLEAGFSLALSINV